MTENKRYVVDYSRIKTEELKPGEIIIHNEELLKRIDDMAKEIAEVYKGKKLMLVGLLTGADKTLTQLREALFNNDFFDVETQYMQVETRDRNLNPRKRIKIQKDISPKKLRGQNVLLVDDIADTLTTYAGVANHFFPRQKNAHGLASFATFSLLEKPALHLEEHSWVPLDFVGFKIPPIWVEGFGLDSYSVGRGNPNIVFGPTPHAEAFNTSQHK